MSPEEVVTAFIDAWNAMDWDAVDNLMHDDIVYHNIPMERIEGKAAASAFIRGMQPEGVDWRTLNIASNGNVVLTERIDGFDMPGGKRIELPVMGTFEIGDGVILAWRDYFDLGTFTAQMKLTRQVAFVKST